MKIWIFGEINYWRPLWASKRGLRFIWQKLTRGFSDDATWSLDTTMAKFIAPRLKRLREIESGHPACYTDKQWWRMVDQMIYSMEAVANQWDDKNEELSQSPEDREKIDEKVQEGLVLFGRNFRGLWW